MGKSTRWFFCKLSRASTMPAWGGKRGFAPAAFAHASLIRPGVWTGNLPVQAGGGAIMAVTVDDTLLTLAEVAALWAGLESAPDAQVFDLRADISSPNSAWTRKTAFLAALENRLVDTGGRMNQGGKSIRHLVRELARTMMFQRFLGRLMPQAPMDAKLSEAMPAVTRVQLLELLEEGGYPTNKLPNANANLRAFYRTAMSEPFTDYGLEAGDFHLGHKTANLKRGG